ncbi:MAG: hypothetical protein AAGP08_05330 [Pseudomonadota bacterium]
MIARLSRLLTGITAQPAKSMGVARPTDTDLAERMQILNADPYLSLADEALGLVSIFDDLKYDRADADLLSPAMRMHAIKKLKPLGFRQISGNVLEHSDANVQVLIPKSHALGASPFDITRYTPKRAQDYYLLTPTQTACQFIDTYGTDDAVKRIKTLIAKHPINIYRLMDYLEKKPTHQDFLGAIGHLKYVQREAITSEPLQRRRALG